MMRLLLEASFYDLGRSELFFLVVNSFLSFWCDIGGCLFVLVRQDFVGVVVSFFLFFGELIYTLTVGSECVDLVGRHLFVAHFCVKYG